MDDSPKPSFSPPPGSLAPAETDEILLLDEVLEDAPPPRALPKPRPMSRPRPGVPANVGPYTVTRTYPSGMADGVFLAYSVSPHGLTTLAVLKWAQAGRPHFEEAREALLDEARALSVIHHPNVVRLLDTGEDDAGCYIAIEHVPGTDLRTLMTDLQVHRRRLPIAVACFVVVGILRGLDHAHRAVDEAAQPLDIVHRDVNPSNILLSRDGHPKLSDFGVVRMRNRSQAQTLPGLVKGKFRYMAPEYVDGGPPSLRSDLYAVGVTLFELLTGRMAFNEGDRRSIFEAIMQRGVDLAPLRTAEVPEPLVAIVARATHRQPEARFASAGAMADALEAWLARSGTYVSPSSVAALLARLGPAAQ